MDLEREKLVFELLLKLLAAPPAEREALARELAAGDAAMREQLLSMEACEREQPEPGAAIADVADERAGSPRQLVRGHSPAERMRAQPGPDAGSEGALESADSIPGAASSDVLSRLSSRSEGSGRYRIQGEVDRGGQGVILRVWDEDLHRHLAMKLTLGRVNSSTEPSAAEAQRAPTPPVDLRTVGRFLEEAQITAQLDHPGIVPVHELGVDAQGRAFFTMKLVKGEDLRAVFARVQAGQDGWSTTRALSVLVKVCEAMSYAHARSVIHRDLKPSNIMVGYYGEVFVMDWGLARVLGRLDSKDLRLQSPGSLATRAAPSEPRTAVSPAEESPLVTMDGDVVGTPAYMSPEQAAGDVDRMGPRSDVYAVGAILYHLLTGRMPHVNPDEHLNNWRILARVREGAPASIHSLAPNVPAELAAICEQAMARAPEQRYSDMSALAEDLRAYLERRVVAAYETGAVAELRKWMVRNKPLAVALMAGVLLLCGGLASSLALKAQSDGNAKLAEEQRQVALAQEKSATQKTNDVLALSAQKDLDDLVARAGRLWPAHPQMIAAYESWMVDARELVDGRAADPERGVKARPSMQQHEAKLIEIRAQALPRSETQRLAERESHPKYARLLSTQGELRTHSRMIGLEPWPNEAEAEAEYPIEMQLGDAHALGVLARQLVETPRFSSNEKALVILRHLLVTAPRSERPAMLGSLAWAYAHLGRAHEALSAGKLALGEALPEEQQNFRARLAELELAIALEHSANTLEQRRLKQADLLATLVELEVAVDERRAWDFADPDARWWEEQLSKLVSGLEALQDPRTGIAGHGVAEPHGWGIGKRLEFAGSIRERSVAGPEAAARWKQASEAIRLSPKYGGLALTPQLGLLPIGPDPDSGLYEFAHLQTGNPAMRAAQGKLLITEATGIVLVLVPAGTFWMGAQGHDAASRNYDPQCGGDDGDESPVHAVTLSPYFLSKYELTQGQWYRIAGSHPSQHGRGYYDKTWNAQGRGWNYLHPVEQISWDDCMNFLKRMDLGLPSEARWEYACRGGSPHVYWCGDEKESLSGAANLADRYASEHGFKNWGRWELWLDDGNSLHAEIGSYRANSFGLHDVYGNVSEWCLDGFDSGFYGHSPTRNPVAPPNASNYYSNRGGAFNSLAAYVRSADRQPNVPNYRSNTLGLRPVRAVATE